MNEVSHPTSEEIIRRDRELHYPGGIPDYHVRPRGNFTPEQITQIRAWRPLAGTGELRHLARELRISVGALCNIRALRSYQHVPAPRSIPMHQDPRALERRVKRTPRKRGPKGRLTEAQVEALRTTPIKHGERTLARLAQEFGISLPLAYAVRTGRSYAKA
jgi:hypothetical protein